MTTVHGARQQPVGLQNVDPASGLTDHASECNILQKIVLDRRMPSDLLIPVAVEQHELPVGECPPTVVAIDAIGRIQRHQRHARHRLRATLEPVPAEQIRQQTEKCRSTPLSLAHRRPNEARIGLGIGVDERNPITLGVFGTDSRRMTLARPRVGAVGIPNEHEPVVPTHPLGDNRFGAVTAPIRDDDDLKLIPMLGEQ